ncbi:glycosyltransferase family 4 protein [Flavobacterium sp. F372]|uniref:Glycosyltransferase family 4 protein n=1 Tax=Flavobacterium bernardetii TaxID=2813823 RepID=A0ABR7IU99_9FLAO|nr:glycosyltransferase family 4 protein [Flavobacterium bernardetii]MBC5833339.1 glycosyltransferase family 4 protein [Flavobacterium bernardetii]NHF68571.1 glycosyltransferase family 4 protein [Flavobacterium bernardetii]
MKIGFLTPEYPHDKTGNSGGLGTSIKNLAHALTALGHEVVILVYEQKQDAVFFDKAVEVHQIENIKIKGLSWYLTRKKLEKIINSLYDNNKIEIIEATDWTGITSFIKPKKCPLVIKLNGSDTYFCHLDKRPVKWINKFHEKRALQNADGHVSVSAYTAKMTNEIFKQNNKFTIIHNGIDMSLFQKNDDITTKNINVILYFGTLIRKKGLLELPHVFNIIHQKNPNAQLVLVGKDASDIISGKSSTWQMMQELFTPSALKKVTYFGPVAYSEVKKQIEKATVCVFPTYAEALPVSWLEAMAMEKAIVASNIGWGNEIVENGVSGFVAHPSNHQEYADRILQLLAEPSLREKMEHNAKLRITSHFEINLIANQNLNFYKKVIEK